MQFSAVILAGGHSKRMGRDKAWLEVDGEPLLKRQIRTVRAAGASEVLISGRSVADYSEFGLPLLVDLDLNLGPLSGIERALATASFSLVLILAVDIPRMTSAFLGDMLGRCRDDFGVVPQTPLGWEPLSAVYPRAAHALAVEFLNTRRYMASEFAKECVVRGMAGELVCVGEEGDLFANWNSPTDVG